MIGRMDFAVSMKDALGNDIYGTRKTLSVLFNDMTISPEEVQRMIETNTGMNDPRIIITSFEQASNLLADMQMAITNKGGNLS